MQLSVGVKEAGPHRAFRDLEDLGDFGMGHSLDIEHGDDNSMVMRQLHHGRVQFFLKFVDGDLLGRINVSVAGCGDEVGIVLDVAVGIVEARVLPAVPFLKKIDRHVDGDRVHPGVEARFSAEIADRAVGLGEDILKQIVGVLVVGGHVVDQTIEPGTVSHHQLIECRRIPSLGSGDQFQVVIGDDFRLRAHAKAECITGVAPSRNSFRGKS